MMVFDAMAVEDDVEDVEDEVEVLSVNVDTQDDGFILSEFSNTGFKGVCYQWSISCPLRWRGIGDVWHRGGRRHNI